MYSEKTSSGTHGCFNIVQPAKFLLQFPVKIPIIKFKESSLTGIQHKDAQAGPATLQAPGSRIS
jgi:hypothetical protein